MVKNNRVLDQYGSPRHICSNSCAVFFKPRFVVVNSETRFYQGLCVLRDGSPGGLSGHGARKKNNCIPRIGHTLYDDEGNTQDCLLDASKRKPRARACAG